MYFITDTIYIIYSILYIYILYIYIALYILYIIRNINVNVCKTNVITNFNIS